MKKQLIAMAVAAGMVAPMVAMAEVTVYGRAHMSLDFNDDGTDSAMNLSSNASRIGFKVSEDLDNGMKAGVQFEGQVEVDDRDAGGISFGRNNFASLGGGFGELRLGNHDTPFKDVRSKLDMFGDRVGDLRGLTRVGAIDADAGTVSTNRWDERFRNSILYISPKLGGSWVIKAHYSTNVDAGEASGPNANDNTALSASVNGMAGPIGLWFAYETWDYTSPRDSDVGMRFGADWKTGPFKLTFMYQSTADQRITLGGVNGTYDRDVMSIGGAWKMGKSTFKLQYAMADDISCSNGVNCSDAKTAASTMGISWDYALSKQTMMYVMYAMTANDDDAFYTVTGGGGHGDNLDATFNPNTGNAEDNSAFSVGYIVKF